MKAHSDFLGSTEKIMTFFIVAGIIVGGAAGLLVGMIKGYAAANISLGAGIGLAAGVLTGIIVSSKKEEV